MVISENLEVAASSMLSSTSHEPFMRLWIAILAIDLQPLQKSLLAAKSGTFTNQAVSIE